MITIVPKDHDFRREFLWRETTDWLIFHHVGDMPEYQVDSEVIHSWHRNRQDSKGNYWNGIGYHLVVLQNGVIEEGRPLEAFGAHTSGMNAISIGVCVVGDFNRTEPTIEQMGACVNIGKWAQEKYPGIKIGGHKTFAATDCPGRLFPLDRIREQIEQTNLSWKQRQTISKLKALADMGYLHNPKMHINAVKEGKKLEDYVFISLIGRVAERLEELE